MRAKSTAKFYNLLLTGALTLTCLQSPFVSVSETHCAVTDPVPVPEDDRQTNKNDNRIEGTIYNNGNSPVAGAVVRLMKNNFEIARCVSDNSGHYILLLKSKKIEEAYTFIEVTSANYPKHKIAFDKRKMLNTDYTIKLADL